jgi:hypothetical protein
MRIILSLLFVTSTSFADHKKAQDIPECANIAKACEAAGFKAGDHQKNGKGLWLDCFAPIAKGKTVNGVTGVTRKEAKSCLHASKEAKNQVK